LLRFWLVAADAQKTPRAVASRGFLPKLKSRSTSANGVANYDGQLTQQWGVHTRWEAVLFERYLNRMTIAPKAIAPIKDPRGFLFDALLQDTQFVPALLKSDRDAIGERDVYDDAYYQAFFATNRAVMERRLNDSIAGVAAMIAGAWEAAGKPAMSLNPPASPQRRRRQ